MTEEHDIAAAATAAIRAGPEPAEGRRGSVDAAARARIGRELQRHYAQVLALPIPDHLRALVEGLAEDGRATGRAEREISR